MDNLKIEIQKAEDKAKAFATEKNSESNTQLLGKLTDLKAELTQSISTIAQAYTDNKIADAKSDVTQYTDTKTQAMKNDIVNSIPTTITTEINQSISGGAIKAMKDAMMTDYKQYVDNSQNAQNDAIDTKLNDLKATLQNYSDHNISELVGGSPEVLNTLYELSNALGNDPNFSSTITTLIGQKLNTSDTTTSVEANKVLRLDENGHIPAAILAASGASTGGGTPSGGTGLTPAEKLKLDGIEEGANKYIHPATHPASMIVEETNKHFITDTERNKLAAIEENANHYVHPATHPATMIVEDSTHRFTSDAEKTKLAGIENGANRYIHPASHPATMIVEDSTHRWFSDAEKTKLAGIEPGATKYVHPATHPASMIVEESNRHFITDEERTKLASIEENANHYVHPVSHPASMIIEDETHKFMTAAEKNKLAGIEENANFYVHPTNHPPTMITEDASHRWFTDEERTKLAGIEAGATSGGGGLTEIDLGDNNVKGVLPITKGGTGSASIDQFIQKLYASGDKQNANFENIYCIVFEDGGKNSGRIKLADLRKKFLPTDEEFKQYLLRLPTI